MPTEILLPALSPTMEKGTLANWLVREGDRVAAGDAIAEIETDKATMEVEAVADGRIARIIVPGGTTDIPVGAVIAVLAGEEETAEPVPPAPDRAVAAKPMPVAIVNGAPHDAGEPGAPDGAASPLARRIALQAGIDLSRVNGSGPGGRILKRDLIARAAEPEAPAAAQKAVSVPPAPADLPYEERRLSTMRRIIAERMVQSKSTVPHFYLSVDVAMDPLLDLRRELNAGEEQKISVNDLLIKALALALQRTPEANVMYAGDHLRQFTRADVSVAVAVEGGLVTPVIRDAASKGVGAIAREMRDLAERARLGRLMPADYEGGTISLSNLGMYGIRNFEAIINPPQVAILAVGAAEERAVSRDGRIVPATVMTATLSCDHRAIDGAIGARLIDAFRRIVEQPLSLMR